MLLFTIINVSCGLCWNGVTATVGGPELLQNNPAGLENIKQSSMGFKHLIKRVT
jgi:hypothetical protein